MVTVSLYWAVIGLMGLVRAVSVGVWIAVWVVVIGLSGVAWYIYPQKTVTLIMLLLLHGKNRWQHNLID